ncbi:hypothetical protein ACFLXI_00235 [Chloroflexota bacterium]
MRWKMLSRSGILCYRNGNEPVITLNFDEAVEYRNEFQYEIPKDVKRQFWGLQIKNILKYMGFDLHTFRNKKRYEQKLAQAINGTPKPEKPGRF